jgi:hypothetical protein
VGDFNYYGEHAKSLLIVDGDLLIQALEFDQAFGVSGCIAYGARYRSRRAEPFCHLDRTIFQSFVLECRHGQ